MRIDPRRKFSSPSARNASPKHRITLTALFLTFIFVAFSFQLVFIFYPVDSPIHAPISTFTEITRLPSSSNQASTSPIISSEPLLSQPFSIHIIGERHSGTNWIEDEMQKCFGHAVTVVPTLFRFKHWWQSPSIAAPPSIDSPPHYGIVIALFRNPYDWMEAMRTEPHHAIEHWDIVPNKPLKWREFLTKTWSMDRLKFQDWMKADLNILKQLQESNFSREGVIYQQKQVTPGNNRHKRILHEFESLQIPNNTILHQHLYNHSCYEDFYWFDIVPCSREDRDVTKMIVPFAEALYELHRDGSGVPFDNILQLRAEKLRHFYQQVAAFPNIQHFFPHRYEDLVTQGTQILIERVQQALPGNIQAQCTPSPPKKYLHKLLPRGMHEYLNQNLNWTVENMVGYRQLSDQDLWEEKQEFNQWNIQNYIQAAEKKAKEVWSHLPATAPRDKSRYGIHILGERHSGTTFLHRHLQECFGHSISIYSNLTRHKYWFQVDDITMDFGFVVGTFRNVYDWLQDMMDKPIHAPLHFDFENNQPFPFQSFLTREWGLDRQRFKKLVQDDLRLMEFYENANANETHGKAIHMESCYENFTFYDIIPCSWEDRNRTNSIVTWSQENLNTDEDDGDFGAVYEMKMDHSPKRLEPYRSILELRRDKIIHLYIEVSKFVSVSHFTAVRYEDLVEMGTSLLVKEIEEKMGIQSQCIPRKLPENVNKRTKKRQKTFLSMVNEGVDWSVEALLGYERIQVGRNSK